MNEIKNDRSGKFLGALTLIVLFALGIVYTLMGPARSAGSRQFAALRQSQSSPQSQSPSPSQEPAPPAENRPGRPNAPARSPSDRPTPQIYHPPELVQLLSGSNKPTIVSVSSRSLYDTAHVTGAIFHGAASTRDGLKDLKQWAETVPKTMEIVLYCGCCPMKESPNLRPALSTLREMGFTHVHVLWLEHDFQTDWVAKGYPTEKGK
jgi:hypothetical protein